MPMKLMHGQLNDCEIVEFHIFYICMSRTTYIAMHANISVIECPNCNEHVRFLSLIFRLQLFLIDLYGLHYVCGTQYNSICYFFIYKELVLNKENQSVCVCFNTPQSFDFVYNRSAARYFYLNFI